MQLLSEQKSVLSLPAFTLMLTLVLLPTLDAGFDHHVIYWVLFLLLAVSISIIYMKKMNLNIDLHEPLLWYLLFIVWGGISIFWSINPHRTLVEFLQLVCYGLAFFLALNLNEDNIFRVGRIALIAAVGIALFGISEYLFLTSARIKATFTNSNPLGIYLVMFFFLGWSYYLRRPNCWLITGCVILLAALALTGSRGAYICFFLTIPFLFLGLNQNALYKGIGKTILCIALALIITKGIMLIAPYLQEFAGRQLIAFLTRHESFLASSGAGRLAFWEVAAKLAVNEPIRGYGLGTFHLAYYLEYANNQWYSRFAHNHYLQVLVELGIVGFILIMGFLITCGKKVWQRIKRGEFPDYFPGLLAVLIAFLINIGGDFSWNFPGSAVIFFVAAGVAVGAIKHQDIDIKKIKYQYVIAVLLVFLFLSVWQFSANMMYRRGVILESQGNINEATLVYEKANTFYPINSMGYYFASRNYLQLANDNDNPELLDNALDCAQKSVRLSPIDGNLHNNLGKIYWQKGNLDKAEHHLMLAVKYAAYRLGMFLDMGWFYFQQEKMEDAKSILLNGLELEEAAIKSSVIEEDREMVKTQLLQMHLILAQIYWQENKPELMDNHMQEAKKLDREHQAVKKYFGH
ncbi:MAG: O-antigen ligase family protein [Syntrophomonadaceae bacterium]